MKIRNGFVSNSSSSSTIVVVNPAYKATAGDFLQALNKVDYLDMEPAEIVQMASDPVKLQLINGYLDVLKNGEALWEETIDRQLQVGYGHTAAIILKLPGVHSLASINTSSDAGQIAGVKASKIKAIAKGL